MLAGARVSPPTVSVTTNAERGWLRLHDLREREDNLNSETRNSRDSQGQGMIWNLSVGLQGQLCYLRMPSPVLAECGNCDTVINEFHDSVKDKDNEFDFSIAI